MTTFTSQGNIFLLIFRALAGFERKGFKANYSTIPVEVSTISTLPAKETASTKAVMQTYSISTKSVSTKSPTTNVLSTTPTTSAFSQSLKTSTQVSDFFNGLPTTYGEMTLPQSTKSSNKFGIAVAIATSIILVIVIILIASLFVRKYKMTNREKSSPRRKPLKSLTKGNTSTDEYEVVTKENGGVIESKYENTDLQRIEENSTAVTDTSMNVQQLGYSKEIIRQHKMDTPDGTYETPDVYVYSQPDPNEFKFCMKQ